MLNTAQWSDPPVETMVSPATVVPIPVCSGCLATERRILAFVRFFDESGGEKSFDGSVKRAGADAHCAVGGFGDIGHDAVTVTFAACEAEKDMKGGRRKRRMMRWTGAGALGREVRRLTRHNANGARYIA